MKTKIDQIDWSNFCMCEVKHCKRVITPADMNIAGRIVCLDHYKKIRDMRGLKRDLWVWIFTKRPFFYRS